MPWDGDGVWLPMENAVIFSAYFLEPFPCDMIVTSKAGSSNWSLMNWRRQSSSFLDPRVTNLPLFPAGADVWGGNDNLFPFFKRNFARNKTLHMRSQYCQLSAVSLFGSKIVYSWSPKYWKLGEKDNQKIRKNQFHPCTVLSLCFLTIRA